MGWTVYNSDGQILQGSSTLADDAVTTAKIADDAVTYAKMQNLATADRVLGSASTGVIGEVQIVPDMLASDAVTTVKILDANVTNAKVATGIDAVKLADGSVTNAELQYINTLSSNAQTQLAAKQATIDSSARLDAASIGANGNVSNTEYGYLSGVTSDIQTQISAAGGAVTRAGGNSDGAGTYQNSGNTEATTTSTSAVDLLAATSLTIAAAEPFYFVVSGRKTTGSASGASLGIKLNGTIVGDADGTGRHVLFVSTANEVSDGTAYLIFNARVTDYLKCGTGSGSSYQTGGTSPIDRFTRYPNLDSLSPTAEITDVIIRGRSLSASQTLGSDELHVYSLAAS